MFLDKVTQDLRQAQLSKDVVKVSTLRMLISELRYEAIRLCHDLSDEESVKIVLKEVKKRKEAAEGFLKAQREEQAKKEQDEEKVLMAYLPVQLSDEELTKIIEQTIKDLGAHGLTDIGKVIGNVRSRIGVSADPAKVSTMVKERLV